MKAYCDCYVDLVQTNVSWHDWLLVDAAIRTKGRDKLDAAEKKIVGTALQDGYYCFQKTVK